MWLQMVPFSLCTHMFFPLCAALEGEVDTEMAGSGVLQE